MDYLKIAYITPEAVPYAKTGGLADVSGALPEALTKIGHDVRVFMPHYRQVKQIIETPTRLDYKIRCQVGEKMLLGDLYHNRDSLTGVNAYFVSNDPLFDRAQLYRDPETGEDYRDNDERFIFFCQAVLQSFKLMNWRPDIIHAQDWQSALAVTYIKTLYADDPFFKDTKTIFTIHNMAYQGQFPPESYKKVGVEDSYFGAAGPFEYWGRVNLMKSAIHFADMISTVSPTYAKEIQSSNEFGMGLEGVLSTRSANLVGILNGVDYRTWSPKKDNLIPYNYFRDNLSGKKRNKLELLHRCHFPLRTEQPLFGMISRLDVQKGFDLIEEIIDDIFTLDLQLVLLGTGDERFHDLFRKVEEKYPNKFRAFLTFDNNLAHLIEAASDIFLMPSRFEPCGLNQLYSLKYGSVPLVRETGGLADTVIDFDEENKTGTGFTFENYNSSELLDTIKRAIRVFAKRRTWYKIMKQGMDQDFSWNRSAAAYVELYRKALSG